MGAFLENILKIVNEAAKIAHVPGDILARLQKPDKIIAFEILLKMDNGSERKFPAWRVQHNNALGPYKGGIRFHPEASLDEVEALSFLMTLKTSLMGLPFGGAKGAIRVDPRSLSMRELEALSRGYIQGLWREIGPRKDVPAPDVGTNPQIMDWMADEYGKLIGKWEPATFTGKSVEKGGSQGRDSATGFGGYIVLREYLALYPESYTPNPTVAIQGFGNVGSHIAKILFDNGFTVVAISDSKGALYEESGIDINKVLEIKEKTGIIDRTKCYALSSEKIAANTPCKEMSNEDLLTLPVDILIPAALENQITSENAKNIRAKMVCEMANGPTTREAEEILTRRGIEVIPDILANSGGVVASHFEWVQSLQGNYWNEGEVLKKIEEKLVEAFRDVAEMKAGARTTWRSAAYIKALTKIAGVMR